LFTGLKDLTVFSEGPIYWTLKINQSYQLITYFTGAL